MKKIVLSFFLTLIFFTFCFNAEAKISFPVDDFVVPYSEYLGGYGSLEYTKVFYDANNYETGGIHYYKMPYLLDIPADNCTSPGVSSYYHLNAGSNKTVSFSYQFSKSVSILHQLSFSSSLSTSAKFKIPFSNGVIGEIGGESEITSTESYSYEESRYFGFTSTNSVTYYVNESGYYQHQLRIRVNVYIVAGYYTYGSDKLMPSRCDDGSYKLMFTYSSSTLGIFKYKDLGSSYVYDDYKVNNVVYID